MGRPMEKSGEPARLPADSIKEKAMTAEIADIPALASGRTAVITGGASGIGLATARRLVAAGMNVVIADRPGAALDKAASEVAEAAGAQGKVLAVACDVAR